MKSESILKGRIAENLTEELLLKCGNRVYRFGGDRIMQDLEQAKISFSREGKIGEKISSIPDFVVFNKKKKFLFLEVKFRSDPESLEEELLLDKESLEKFWEAKIVLITSKNDPYFRVLTPPYFSKEKKEGWPIPVLNWSPIEDDADIGADPEILKEFNELVEKYYKI